MLKKRAAFAPISTKKKILRWLKKWPKKQRSTVVDQMEGPGSEHDPWVAWGPFSAMLNLGIQGLPQLVVVFWLWK